MLRDSDPFAGLVRAASLSSESSSSESVTPTTRPTSVDFLGLGFVLPDRATATPLIEVVRDFAPAEVPEA